jgi:acyl-CoA dehydrogenase family protein 9
MARSRSSGGHSTIGIKALLLYGTEEQKARYLPRLATGELIAAFALSEPGAGSDAQSLHCTARRDPDGSWVLNGEKLWITNGGFAGLLTVFARTPDAPRADGRPSISCFLVERAHGFRSGPEEDKLGICGSSTTSILFEDVRVPPRPHRPGGPASDRAARAQRRAHRPRGRLGAGASCCEMVAYVAQRQQFGRPIGVRHIREARRCALDCTRCSA